MKSTRRNRSETAFFQSMKGLRRSILQGVLLLALLSSGWGGAARAQEPDAADENKEEAAPIAQLPYQALVGIARGADGPPEDGEKMNLRISSTEKVPVKDISLTIQRKDGPQVVDINEEGDFEVPYSQELYEENPMVISNQPRGTMDLNVLFDIKAVSPKVVDGKVKYQALFEQLLELKKVMVARDPNFGSPGYQALALQIVTEGEAVTLVRAHGSRTIEPGKDGSVWMVHDVVMHEENPDISLPENAQVNIQPIDAQTAIAIRAQ
jgi:hypothetical protein